LPLGLQEETANTFVNGSLVGDLVELRERPISLGNLDFQLLFLRGYCLECLLKLLQSGELLLQLWWKLNFFAQVANRRSIVEFGASYKRVPRLLSL
jgi:hypothetical protein